MSFKSKKGPKKGKKGKKKKPSTTSTKLIDYNYKFPRRKKEKQKTNMIWCEL